MFRQLAQDPQESFVQRIRHNEGAYMNGKPQDSEISPEQTRREYRKLAREIEQAFSAAKMRRSVFGAALLEEMPSLYEIDAALMLVLCP